MDGDRFDDLAKRLGSRASRRGALKVLGGGAAAGALALFGRGRAGAAPAGKVGICHQTGSATNPLVFIVVSEDAIPAHTAHGDTVAVDLQTDPDNCGACGNVCGGDVCNTPVCQGGQCGTVPVVCDDSNACTADSCDVAQGGCVNTPISCDDNNACTADSCDPLTGCVNTPISCDDNNVCTTDSCDPATGCANTPISCDDGVPCTVDTCDPVSGCANVPDDALCVDDGNECTADFCDPVLGCVNDPTPMNDAPCDGGTGTCRNGVCDPNFCGSYILAGTGGIDDPFVVDDDLRVFLNDVLLFEDDSGQASVISPIGPFTATGGDTIRFEAIDSFGACRSLEEVTLYCADGSATQQATEGFAGEGCEFTASPTPYFVDEVVIAI